MSADLFAGHSERHAESLAPGVVLLPGFAGTQAVALLAAVDAVATAALFRQMITPGGYTMGVAMTNCGELGWVSDRRGYRYDPRDPESGKPWPALPQPFVALAEEAALASGFSEFKPDACLINRYLPGTRLSLHQDRNERDFSAPIVSVSLGLPAAFLLGGLTRQEKAGRLRLQHGDVLVWGGPARLRFHGILPLADGSHPLTGNSRINLTFRRAG